MYRSYLRLGVFSGQFSLPGYIFVFLCCLGLFAGGCSSTETTEVAEAEVLLPLIESRSFSDFQNLASNSSSLQTRNADDEVEVESSVANEPAGTSLVSIDTPPPLIEDTVVSNSDANSSDAVDSSVQEEDTQPLTPDSNVLFLDDRTEENVVRLVKESITLRDCVMRGEIHNYSEDQYARDVTVTVGALDGKESAVRHWPLTIEPGESAPFEIAIDWFPHRYNDLLYSSLDFSHWHNNRIYIDNLFYNYYNIFGNMYFDIQSNLSFTPDIKRAIKLNADETAPENLYQNPSHNFLVYDERAFELKDSRGWPRSGRDYTTITKPRFDSIFPEEMVQSSQLDPALINFELYKYTDVFYIPSRMYPDIYKQGVDDSLSNVKIYQAYKDIFGRVFDVRELIPHLIIEVKDAQGLIVDRQFNPIYNFGNYDIAKQDTYSNKYVQVLDRFNYFKASSTSITNEEALTRNPGVESVFLWSTLWAGGASHSKAFSSSGFSPVVEDFNPTACFSSWPLCNFDFSVQSNSGIQIAIRSNFFGKHSKCPISASSATHRYALKDGQTDSMIINTQSLRIQDQTIRGSIFNLSMDKTARNVVVSVIDKESRKVLGKHQWSLSVQPREIVPFEIMLLDAGLNLEEIVFDISSVLSEDIDPTRSFQIQEYVSGTVYGKGYKQLYKSIPLYQSDYEMFIGDILGTEILQYPPSLRYTKDEFKDIYRDILVDRDMEQFELFRFIDLYARLESSDLHPELAKIVANQFIGNLHAYMAIFDGDKVVDVKEVPLFTSIEEQSNIDQNLLLVDSIPAPNRWAPNAVRMLVIIPYTDEEDLDKEYGYQVWIGGANSEASVLEE